MEEEAALGGMRNPKRSCERLPEAKSTGEFVRDLLDHTVNVYPDLLETAHDILSGAEQVREIEGHNYDVVKAAVLKLLETEVPLPAKTARASSPLNAQAIWDWGHLTDDPDATTLAEWIQQGAPLGFDEPITCNGVFPKVSGTPADLPSDAEIRRPSEGWQNWPSADEEIADLRELVKDAEKKGFCEVTRDEDEALKILGDKPVLNKLGVVVKFSGQTKKSRIIWDLRESGVNLRCDTAERIVLPRLLDVVQETLEAIRNDQEPIFAAIDIRDAFHNVPAGKDRKYTVARADGKFIIYNVLVFGSRSSPTIWGRFAAFIGRTLLCIVPELGCQIYVDDPIFVIPGKGENAARFLTLALLVFKIFGFPVKLAKASAGQVVKWIGAELSITQDPDGPLVMVKIPEEKVEKLLQEVDNFLKAPVVGTRQLRSFAGGMAFVAGLVPILRPFLAPLWAALSKDSTNEGGASSTVSGKRLTGKLIHVKRIATSLAWIGALLRNQHGSLVRRFRPSLQDDGWELVTDACPWGIGGVLYHKTIPVRWFASDLTPELLGKFKASRGDSAWNTTWEAFALLVAIRLWLPDLPRLVACRVKSDNVGALRLLLSLVSSNTALATIAREIAMDMAENNYQLNELVHIKGVTNVFADALSRLYAPNPEPFPNLGNAIKDPVPFFGDNFWKVP